MKREEHIVYVRILSYGGSQQFLMCHNSAIKYARVISYCAGDTDIEQLGILGRYKVHIAPLQDMPDLYSIASELTRFYKRMIKKGYDVEFEDCNGASIIHEMVIYKMRAQCLAQGISEVKEKMIALVDEIGDGAAFEEIACDLVYYLDCDVLCINGDALSNPELFYHNRSSEWVVKYNQVGKAVLLPLG